ncbi:hypothetical protein [Martelella alba]|uniref:YD repeat-containing protein n=1 Tax=Martelella alba TaxID=2590451 RepID=A0ABY2SMX6_9HYPH|nr:hypothetical protein [Martelella alba]TKI06335.1 hypothetical protein FCN80_10880 [Martelella alba]
MKFWLIGTACMLASLTATGAFAADACFARHRLRNDNNNLIMLDGLGKGNIKLMVSGMVGKDVDEQASGNVRFDRCGVLADALFDYRKNERNVSLRMVNHTARTAHGWMTDYELAVIVDRDGHPELATHKQGQILFSTDKLGQITSASDAFVLDGDKGFTTTIYYYDKQRRLVKSVARGSDVLANDQYLYHYDDKGRLHNIVNAKGVTTFHYDGLNRETGSERVSTTSVSQTSKSEQCRRFDDAGNCTLSYARETEIFPTAIIHRNTSTAMQYNYW